MRTIECDDWATVCHGLEKHVSKSLVARAQDKALGVLIPAIDVGYPSRKVDAAAYPEFGRLAHEISPLGPFPKYDQLEVLPIEPTECG